MDPRRRSAELLELCDGYTADDALGEPAGTLKGIRIAVEGGYLHIAHPGSDRVQIVSAPGVKRVVYLATGS
ncbi:MAG: hypothetical protein ACJ786_35435 [Catenulispora sp.]